MSSFFGRLVGSRPKKRAKAPKRHIVIHSRVPSFRKQHKKTYYRSLKEDKIFRARRPGKRPAVKGKHKTYYEYRVNRADLSRSRRL